PLPQPILSLDPPSSVILPGEEVPLVCRFPLTLCNVEIYRYLEELSPYVSEVNYTAKVKLEADIKWKGNNGYTCKYRKYFENNRTWACSPYSDSVQLIVTDKLPKPTLSIETVSGVVTVGERVQFNCTTSYPIPISHLYKKRGKKPVETRNVSDSERSVILTMKDLEPEDSGEYSCNFEKTVKGKVYESPRSNFVEINVTDKLPNPTASIEPVSGVVTVGERVLFKCTTSYPIPMSHLYKKYGKEPVETWNASDSERSVILTMEDLEQQDSGEYSCSFEKTVKGKVYESPRSNFVEINVTATLPRANISVDPPSGVVSRGSTIRITCTGSILNSGGCFRLYRDGEENGTLEVSGPQQSATFTITDTDTEGTWNYTCHYTRTVKKKTYRSPGSNALQVTVKPKFTSHRRQLQFQIRPAGTL
ncbi:immunoglobulin superfamily member 1-like, partial [Cetorhinus maximus]